VSSIKFSFEGQRDDLVHILQAMAALAPHSSQTIDEMLSSLVPRPVSDQAPPPAAPKLTPDQYEAPRSAPGQSFITDPVYPDLAAHGPDSSLAPSNPAPTAYPPQVQVTGNAEFDFGSLPLREDAWGHFKQFVAAWAKNFDGEGEQPDRLKLLKDLGESSIAIHVLRWIAEHNSLQEAIAAAFSPLRDYDLFDRLSANIAQVSHAAFPDIAGFHDYSTRWKRNLLESDNG